MASRPKSTPRAADGGARGGARSRSRPVQLGAAVGGGLSSGGAYRRSSPSAKIGPGGARGVVGGRRRPTPKPGLPDVVERRVDKPKQQRAEATGYEKRASDDRPVVVIASLMVRLATEPPDIP